MKSQPCWYVHLWFATWKHLIPRIKALNQRCLSEVIWLRNKPSSLGKISHHNGKDKVNKNLFCSSSHYQKRAKTTWRQKETSMRWMHRHRNIQLLHCLGVVFNTLWQAGCTKHCKTVAGGWRYKKNHVQKHKFLCYTGFMRLAMILAWNAEISPLIKVASMKEFVFRIPAYWLAFRVFLIRCRHFWHL